MKLQNAVKLQMLFCLVFVATCTNAYAQTPTFTSFSPSNAATGETVTITGTNFASITAVSFGGTAAASYTVVSATKITAVVAAGSSGSVSVTKTGYSALTLSGFTFSPIPTVTRIITDFGGFWNTNTTTNSGTYPNDAHNLVAFTYGGVTYATGVNNKSLSDNGIAYTASSFKALPVIMNGTTSGASLFIVAASKIDGNTAAGLYTHPAIKDLSVESVLSDGTNGLNLGTGYTNLPLGATSNFNINSIQPSKASDNEPDIIVTQIADPSTSAFDTYRFLDASNNVVGTSLQIDLSKLAALGTYYLDLFTVASGIPFANAKPTGISSSNTTRQIRLMAFKLSDFGITASNYSQVKRLQIIPSGVTDMAFVAYNTSAINVPPSIAQNVAATSSAICNPGGGSATLAVSATAAAGGALSYNWEVSINGGTTWSAVSNGGIYSGATTTSLVISSATVNYQYRANVTEAGSGYSATSSIFTITAIANTALAGTLDPTGFTNCVNAATGTTSLSVSPTGGTGSYSYQWSSSTTLGGTYTNIAGAIYSSYSPSLTTAGTLYYKVLITSGCLSRLSSGAQVVINGADISTVTNGSACSAGAVSLSATATGGTINWYTAATGGTSIGTGSPFNTPSISATTTYYVGTTLSSCSSNRQPVIASIVNTITLSSANFNVTYASNVCSGAGSNITVTSTALVDGAYQFTYNITGSNTVTGATATVNFVGGTGFFTTSALVLPGSNTITITSVNIGSCPVTPSSGNTIPFTVNSASPSAASFNLSVSNGCSNEGSVATVSSTTLASGTYIVTYNITGSNTVSSTTAQMVFTSGAPGTGTFALPTLGNVGSNVANATSIALLSSPDCSTPLLASSPSFASNKAAVVDGGTPKDVCASNAVNITGGSSAENYTALTWSSSNGTGSFASNTTANALSATTYTPSAADITRGFAYMTLTATPASGCAVVAKTITLTISATSVGGTASGNQTISSGTQPTTDLTLSGNTGTITKWQKATNAGFTTPTDIANTTATLTGTAIGTLTTTTYFRAVSQSGTCTSAASSAAVVTVSGTMPITLLYFNADCNGTGVLLRWSTATEINNDHFTIERSVDGSNWLAIRNVQGAGNSNTTLTYSYKDNPAQSGSYFYRLKQTDIDGTLSYSEMVKIDCNGLAKPVSISPNPGKSFFDVRNLPLRGSISVTDMKGKIILPLTSYTGIVYRINLSNFAAGTYAVTVYAGDKVITKILVKE
ncbi:MAG: T9SS type A sorting domain-containing protein [Agriterribacter sp.]